MLVTLPYLSDVHGLTNGTARPHKVENETVEIIAASLLTDICIVQMGTDALCLHVL